MNNGINAGSVYANFVLDLSSLQGGVNQAKRLLQGLQNNVASIDGASFNKLGNSISNANSQLDQAIGILGSFKGAFLAVGSTIAGLQVFEVLGNQIAFFNQQINEAIAKAEDTQKAFAATGVIAKKMGYDVNATLNFVNQLSERTQFSGSAIANFAQQLIKSGASLSDISEIILLFQDNLIALPNLTKSFDEALEQLGDSFVSEMTALLNTIGLSDKTWEQLKETGVASLKEQGIAVTDTKAKIEGLRLALQDTQGVGSILGNTVQQEFSKLEKILTQIQVEIGEQLKPVLIELLQLSVVFLSGLRQVLLSIDWRMIAEGILTVSSLITVATRKMMQFISSLPAPLLTAMSGVFSLIKKKTNDTGNSIQSLVEKINNANLSPLKLVSSDADKTKKAVRDISQNIEEETYNYNKRLANIVDQRQKQIEANKQALEKEREDYEKTLEKKEQSFQDSIRRLEKTRAEELKRSRKQEEDKLKDYQEKTQRIKEEGRIRLRDLQRRLAQELDFSGKHNEENIALLRKQIEYEEEQQQRSIEELNAKLQQELQELKEATNEKIQVIDAEIEEKRRLYESETKTLKAEYEKRTQELKAKIEEDEAFLRKHADTIKTINRNLIQDEIDELNRQYQNRLTQLSQYMQQQQGIIISGASSLQQSLANINLSDALGFNDQSLINEEVFLRTEQRVNNFIEWIKQLFTSANLGFVFLNSFNNNFITVLQNVLTNLRKILENSIFVQLGKSLSDIIANVLFSRLDNVLQEIFNRIFNIVPIRNIFKSGFNAIITQINEFIGKINSTIREINKRNFTPFKIAEIPTIPNLYTGGTIARSGLAFINEKGFELVNLPKGAQVYPRTDSVKLMNNIKTLINAFTAVTTTGLQYYPAAQYIPATNLTNANNTYNYFSNNFTVKSGIDIRKIAQELEFELKTRGL
jgi:hypothetical protein